MKLSKLAKKKLFKEILGDKMYVFRLYLELGVLMVRLLVKIKTKSI